MWLSTLEISPLLAVHKQALGVHFLGLPADDRYARFGVTLGDEALLGWLARMDWQAQRWWGAWLPGDLGLVGSLQLIPTPQARTWELAMTVNPLIRQQGVGTRMLSTAVAQTPEAKCLICHHGHAAVYAMARRLRYTVDLQQGTSKIRT